MKISVIIVSFNTKRLLLDCLNSVLRKTKGLETEIIVVDNASDDGSIEAIEKIKIKLIKNKDNLGFARANNQGIKESTGDYILLLNSDTKFLENSLKTMTDFMEEKRRVGIATCQLVGENGEVQPSGGFSPNLIRVAAWMFFLDDLPDVNKLIKSFHPHPPSFYTKDSWYQSFHYQDWVTGAFFLIRKKVIDQIGLLDENFFMYVEELEYCYRAKKAGWQIAYNPATKIIHFGGKSGTSRGAILGEYQGLRYFFAKHRPFWQGLVLRVFLKVGAILRIIVFGIIRNNKEAKDIYAQAYRIA